MYVPKVCPTSVFFLSLHKPCWCLRFLRGSFMSGGVLASGRQRFKPLGWHSCGQLASQLPPSSLLQLNRE